MTEKKSPSFFAVGVCLLYLCSVSAETTARPSFRGSINSDIPRVSLRLPVTASGADFVGRSREDVLSVYPSKFVVDWDSIPTTWAAAWVYRFCGAITKTTCEVREHDVSCWCRGTLIASGFADLQNIPEKDLNTPVYASGPDPVAVPTMEDVLDAYGSFAFSIDWSVGHGDTAAAGILFDVCGLLPTTCILEEARLECLCKDFASPIFLGYETLRSGNDFDPGQEVPTNVG
jgi:hypothetical protein